MATKSQRNDSRIPNLTTPGNSRSLVLTVVGVVIGGMVLQQVNKAMMNGSFQRIGA